MESYSKLAEVHSEAAERLGLLDSVAGDVLRDLLTTATAEALGDPRFGYLEDEMLGGLDG